MADPSIWSEAEQEAYATARAGTFPLNTFEIIHPLILDGETPDAIRLVLAERNWDLTLEATAPVKAGQEVTFYGRAMMFRLPEQEEARIQGELEIVVDNVRRDLLKIIRRAATIRASAQLIYRVYMADDTSQPSHVLAGLTVKVFDITDTRITLRARFADLMALGFPRRRFTPEHYAGLFAA